MTKDGMKVMEHPNVLLIHCDQLRFDALGCHGNPHARTPAIDSLAADGCAFSRHIAGSPICSPSRACLMTGLYPLGHNLWCNGVALPRAEYASAHTLGLDRSPDRDPHGGPLLFEPPTLGDLFSQGGYDTACFGKMHLTPWGSAAATGFHESTALWSSGALDDWRGPYYGFNHAELALGHGERGARVGPYARWLEQTNPDLRKQVLECLTRPELRERPVPALADLYPSMIPSDLHMSAWLAGRFSDYLMRRQGSDRPWMAWVGFPDPHHPFTPSFDVARRFEQADVPDPIDPEGHAAACSPALGRAHTDIRDLTIEERRMVARYTHAMVHQIDAAVGRIVQAVKDAGQWDRTIIVFTSDHGDYMGDHGKLRKGFNGSHPLLNVPFILRVPGVDLPRRSEVPMSNVDVLPTLASLAGLPLPPVCDGIEILPFITDGRSREVFYYGYSGDPKTGQLGVYDQQHRLAYYPADRFVELYDHAEDSAECRNLGASPDHRLIVDHLMDQLRDHLLHSVHPAVGRVAFW